MNENNRLINRRNFLNLTGTGGMALVAAVMGTGFWSMQLDQAIAATTPVEPLSPDAALKRLREGNQRFVQQKSKHPDQSPTRIKEVAQEQHPFVAMLSCADSRVPPEILFDEGIGDLFDIRVAGNIVTPEVLGSLEYAVACLNTPLIMVLGHERCGAVTAAVDGKHLPGHIDSFVKPIIPVVAGAKGEASDPVDHAVTVDNAVTANVRYQINKLTQNSLILSQRSLAGKLQIVGGRYDLDSGEVTIV